MSNGDLPPEESVEEETADRKSIREGLEAEAGVRRLLRMSSLQSIQRNMKREDRAYDEDIDLHQEQLWGEDAVNSATKEKVDDEMGYMAARDIIIHTNDPPKQEATPAPAPTPTPRPTPTPTPATPTAAPAGTVPAWQAALAAISLATGAGGLTYGLTRPDINVLPSPPTDNQYDIGLLPPDPPVERP